MAEREDPPLAEHDRIITAALAGDRYATNQLLAYLQPAVIRYCRGRLGKSSACHSADDVAQEVLLAVFHALPRYRGTAQTLNAFVFGIARKKVVDAYRAQARDKSTSVESMPEVSDTSARPEDMALHGELRSELDGHIAALTDNQREVIVLRLHVGLSAEETAQAMSTSAAAVRVTQHRGLRTLRRRLEADGRN